MDELTYRHQRLAFTGEVYWQRFHDPWRLFAIVKALNISLSGILVQKPLSTIAQTTENVLQINDDSHTVVLPALVVRHTENHLAFSFKQTTAELEQLIADLNQRQT